ADVKEALGPIFADPGIAKVGHDLKYVEVALGQHGMPFAGGTFDVMIASYLLDPEAVHTLPRIAQRELDETLLTFDQVTSKARGSQLAFDEVDVDNATTYAGRNADAVLRLAEHLGPQLERQGLSKVMNDIEMPLSRLLAEMERI